MTPEKTPVEKVSTTDKSSSKVGREEAPVLETPEDPRGTPKDTPRATDSELETPEAKGTLVAERVAMRQKSTDELEDDQDEVEETALFLTREELELREIHLHISPAPVYSHAPIWGPHETDPPGGYS